MILGGPVTNFMRVSRSRIPCSIKRGRRSMRGGSSVDRKSRTAASPSADLALDPEATFALVRTRKGVIAAPGSRSREEGLLRGC